MIPSLNILMICPAPRGSRKGNRVTADRWAGLLRKLGHQVTIRRQYDDTPCDLMIALHARRSAQAIDRFARLYPERSLVVALTGTDLYRDIRSNRRAQRSLQLATRLVVLQPKGVEELRPDLRRRTRSIPQSAEPTPLRLASRGTEKQVFRVSVLGHLRHEKDPLRTALATRLLPKSSKIFVTHLGEALTPAMGKWARSETLRNPRYVWLGELAYAKSRRILARSDLMVLSSRMEGGANVLSEALADAVPIVASDIPSTRGILGDDYPGLYPVGDTRRLAELIHRAETDPQFYGWLKAWCRQLAPRVRPAAERAAWDRLIRELYEQKRKPQRVRVGTPR